MRAGSRNAMASVLTALTGIAAALLTTPLILHHVGRSAYGVWTVAMALIIYLGIFEAGLAPTSQRFVAMARGAGDLHGARRVFWSTLAFYALLGVVSSLVVEALAPAIVDLFDTPPRLHDDAVGLLRIVGLALPLGLLVAALANALQGFERFRAVAVTSALGSLAYLAAVIFLTSRPTSLADLGWAVIVQQGVLLITRAALVLDVLNSRPALVSRAQAREMAALSARLQVSVASLIINGQSDRVVAGLVARPAVVGQVGIGAQVAEAGRMVATAPLVPIINRFAHLHGTGEEGRLHAAYARVDRLWVTAGLGLVAIGVAVAAPLVHGWLGDGYGLAQLYATLLVAAYGVNMLVGVRTAYLRSTGNAGLESRLGVVLMVLNLACTVPLAVAFGATGVVAGTLVAYVLGTVWFTRVFPRAAPGLPPLGGRPVARAGALALAAAIPAGLWGWFSVGLVPVGWGLLLVGAGAAVAAVAYLSVLLGVRPGRGALAAVFGDAVAASGTSTTQSP